MKYLMGVIFPAMVLGPICLFDVLHAGLILWVLLGWALMSGLGIAVGAHRVYSHKTHVELKPWMDNLLLFLATIAGQGSTITWVAVHRGYHHRFTDTAKDLHSPVHGKLQSLFGWYAEINEKTINHKYAVELLRRPNHVWVHKHYFRIFWGFWFLMLLIPGAGVVYTTCLMISLLQDNLVNLLGHTDKIGYRNWNTKDFSQNYWPLGYFAWGQGWHNNHHNAPEKYSFKHHWWEIDPTVIFLPLLWLGSKRRTQ